jgi:sugar transferase (PEP-CTERM/EpsH1 system associated)
MRILWLKADLLLPLDKGGRLRTWHLLRHLKAQHDVTYVSFGDPAESAGQRDRMRDVADRIVTVPRVDAPKGSVRFLAGAAWRLLDPLPYAVGRYRSRTYRRRVDALLRERTFDLIVCDFLPPAVNLRWPLPCPAVLFTHNVEAEIWRRHAEITQSRAMRGLYSVQHRRMCRFEAQALGRFDAVLTVSDADRVTFGRLYPGAARGPVRVVPTGVDTEFFTPTPSPPAARSLVFTGSMDWLPNEDAMIFFCREILPRIRAEEPDVSLTIVGRSPTPAVRRLAELPGVTVAGRVEDVRPHVGAAAVYVVPLRIGGGTRLKIFEAMAMGKAIVSTVVGAEGLPVTPGDHLVIENEPGRFASAILTLLRDVSKRRQLEAAGRRLVAGRYDWASAGRQLDDVLTRVAQQGLGAAAGASLSHPLHQEAPQDLP